MEEYVKVLLEQIRCKPAKKMVEQEIRGHILEQYEANLEEGMDETMAMEEAVKDMGNPVEAGVALDAIHKPQISWGMLGILAVVSFFSILVQALIGKGNPELGNAYILKHIFHVVLGFCLMLAVYRLDYSFLGKYAKKIAVAGSILIVAALCFGGAISINGGYSWIQIGPLPAVSLSALLFLAVPVYGGILYSYYGTGYPGLIKAVLWMVPPIYLAVAMAQPFQAVMLLFLHVVLLSAAVGKGWFQVKKFPVLAVLWGSGLILPPVLLALGMKLGWFAPYQMKRLAVYLGQAELDPDSTYYFLKHSISQCRLWGPGEIPDTLVETGQFYYSDYLFNFISTHYGILAAGLLAVLVLAVAVKGFAITIRQKNQLGRMVGFACGMVILTETCMNLLVCIGWIPPTSSFLPLLSSGGSHLIVFYTMLGLMLSVYRYKSILPSTRKSKGNPEAGQISA